MRQDRPFPWAYVGPALVLLAFALLPLGVSGYILGILTVAFYFAVYAMSWDLLFGFAIPFAEQVG